MTKRTAINTAIFVSVRNKSAKFCPYFEFLRPGQGINSDSHHLRANGNIQLELASFGVVAAKISGILQGLFPPKLELGISVITVS
jgi:hypothetical protein